MRRVALYITTIITLLSFHIYPVYAQVVPTPQPDLSQPQQAPSATLTPKDNALQTITTIKNFVTSADNLLGGFIFYTPDVFANTITLKDGTVLPGLASYRNIFYTISIPLIALAVAYFAMKRLSDDTPYALKSLVQRLVLVAALFIITPTLLSYSIQANNLLVNQITSNQTFSTFITDFLNNEQTQIINGADPQQFGIPNAQQNILLEAGSSLWQFLLQIILYLLALFFFLIGFLFIAFQFIIRFASLLFLSVLYPLAIPFVISEKTEGITNTYFKTWFMFLIHQPAFALGYMLAIGFLEAILKSNGASLGMLFFYSGFLFFLGGVSTLVTHVFGTSWSAISTNFQAAMITAPFGKSFDDFKRGAITGNASGISSLAGKGLGNGLRNIRQKLLPTDTKPQAAFAGASSGYGGYRSSNFVSRQQLSDMRNQGSSVSSYPASPVQPASQQTIKSSTANPQKQTVHMQQTGYSVTNKKTGVTTTYLSPQDAKADGYKSSQLKQTPLAGKYLDLASPSLKTNSSAQVKELLLKHKGSMENEEVSGIMTRQPSRKTNEPITRIYSKEKL
jgi:hypothetical protein